MAELNILKYIQDPEAIKSCELDKLRQLVAKYPYYQTAHVFLLKYLKDNSTEDFESQLIKSSIHVSDRDLLFRFLNTKFENKAIDKDVVTVVEEEPKTKDNKKVEEDSKILKHKNVKRKINNSFEGLGENISETISSQLEFSVVKENDKLEYPSEIYFIEEERAGNNNVITIDADPDDIKKIKKQKDILQIDEKERKEKIEEKVVDTIISDEAFELIETEKIDKSESNKNNNYFDISNYADESVISQSDDLISRFIDNNPRIKAIESVDEINDVSGKSIEDDSTLLSETLIKVYIKQELFEKAIQSYRKLSLKYPEKSTYFASQIKILEDKINKQ